MITHFNRDDGFGAQYQTILFSIIYADLIAKDYCYTSFSQMAHNYDADSNFLKKKEVLIGLSDIFPGVPREVTSGQIYPIVENHLGNLDICRQFQMAKSHFYNINYHIYRNYNKVYKNRYNIALHFRNINSHDIGDYGYVKFEYFLNRVKLRLDEIRTQNDSLSGVVLHLYSQGNKFQFESYLKELECEVVYHLDESIEDTFRGMVFSNELFMSKSSLSYCAGLLNNGIVNYLPFWHKPEPRWRAMESE